MKYLSLALLGSAAGLAMVSGAQAADLPTKKAPPPAATVSCFNSFYDYISASAADCPLSYGGVTLYGTVDIGAGWASNGSRLNGSYPNGIANTIAKFSNGAKWMLIPNGLSQSNIGVKVKFPVGMGWSIVGDVNAGFDPYSLRFANGPQSLIDNNFRTLGNQTANSDSSRTYGLVNSRAYLGVNNPTYGTLTFGRHYTFTNDASSAYDPFGGAYAFSLIGTSGSAFSGGGLTELARSNNSVKYLYNNNGIRAGALYQFGGYNQDNGSQGFWQGDVGFDYQGFSADAMYSRARDAVNLSSYGGAAIPGFATASTLKATLANDATFALVAKYKWNALTLYGGYENSQISNPSDAFGATALANSTSTKTIDAQNVVVQAFGFPNTKVLQLAYIGAKYGIRPDLDIAGGYYHQWQNNYAYKVGQPGFTVAKGNCGPNATPAIAGASPQGSANATCSGTQDVIGVMLDYRPVKRLDVYAGFNYSVVAGGLANGFIKSVDYGPTVGLKLSF